MTKVGLVTVSFTLNARAKYCTKVVLPAPRLPLNPTTVAKFFCGESAAIKSTAIFSVSAREFDTYFIKNILAQFEYEKSRQNWWPRPWQKLPRVCKEQIIVC